MPEVYKLPININDLDVITECWTFNKLAIIKTSAYYRDWIASHYNLFSATDPYYLFWGELWLYPPSYTDSILLRKPLRLFSFTRENIVLQLKKQLQDGYYITIPVKHDVNDTRYHEVLLYGFDDNNQHFLFVGRNEHTFVPMTISYTNIEEAIEEIQNHYLEEDRFGMDMSLDNYNPVTAFKLNPGFQPDNCVFEAFYKIKRELEGGRHDLYVPNNAVGSNAIQHRWNGIHCFTTYQDILEKEINGEVLAEDLDTKFRIITLSSKKILEHQKMMLVSLEYVVEKWGSSMNSKAIECVEEYRECLQYVGKWLNLCIKYQYTSNISLLKKIVNEIPQIVSREMNCLNIFINESINWKDFNLNNI